MRLISPNYFYLQSNDILQTMLTDKRQESVKLRRSHIRRVLKSKGKRMSVYKIEPTWLEQQQQLLTGKLVELILYPEFEC